MLFTSILLNLDEIYEVGKLRGSVLISDVRPRTCKIGWELLSEVLVSAG